MKKQTLFVTVLLIVALLSMAIPMAASAQGELTGDRIRVVNDSMEFSAGAPFYIMHGWVQYSSDGAIGVFDFELEVDGMLLREDLKQFLADGGEPDILWRWWVYAFPEGMTGIHTFTGHWFAPCQYAVEELGYTGSCTSPNAKVETATRNLTVYFVP